ncbi:hypothetical protein [Hoyosella altamirensis]|uniref:Uncharacterized protein n=1 Tax=Hoyosella altamirensis TaxID=616997 RepID=A0A839RSI7_9ACTN|nr:hypothetical protein [Hoyosella altamirensis]MBB3039530.1 hypothetical protein [Hoyosella altamirensis]
MSTSAANASGHAVQTSNWTRWGVAGAVAGAVYGFLVFVVSSWVLLPLTASILGGGDPIRDMPTMVGYPTFIAEHILFGLVVGLLLIPVVRKAHPRR